MATAAVCCRGRETTLDLFSASEAAFASKPAPTLDLQRSQVPCGSGLAREEARQHTAKPEEKKGTRRQASPPL
ncbi:hypothetical protein EAH78_17640 [Pseudomonas arsenicoxydans]|uniref:Uncharacterized protein n=1 Tax=Pseudomonas arsenicoxydans TaxID=702115 RepID=A0A502HNE7_9PSED|nr:hypothetical protein EAH78_17640 [Pseudomonas arsenicoxydans]